MKTKEKENIQNLLQKNGINIAKDDPLWALLEIYDSVLQKSLQQLDFVFNDHLVSLNTHTELYLNRLKELSESKMTDAANNVKKQLEELVEEQEAQHTISTPSPVESKSDIPMSFWFFFTFAAVFGFAMAKFIF